MLPHEPIDIPFALNIHGHTHARVGYGLYDLNHFNVCSNTVGFEPQNLNNLKKITNIIDRHKIICISKVKDDLKLLLESNN